MNIKLPNTYSQATREPMWAIQCDFCRKQAPAGMDAGDSPEQARKAGFTTRPQGLGEPLLWLCPPCSKEPSA